MFKMFKFENLQIPLQMFIYKPLYKQQKPTNLGQKHIQALCEVATWAQTIKRVG